MSLANSSAFGFLVIINELERDLGGTHDFIRNFIWAAPPPTIVPRESPKQNRGLLRVSQRSSDVFLEHRHKFILFLSRHIQSDYRNNLTISQ